MKKGPLGLMAPLWTFRSHLVVTQFIVSYTQPQGAQWR